MGDDIYLPGLRDLARAAGVETDYWDVQGLQHEATAEALLAVAAELGGALTGPAGSTGDHPDQQSWAPSGLADVPRAWAVVDHRAAARLLDDVLVSWEGEPLVVDLRLPDGEAPDHVVWHLVPAGGGAVPLVARPVGAYARRFGRWSVVEHRLEIAWPPEVPVGVHEVAVDLPVAVRRAVQAELGVTWAQDVVRTVLRAPPTVVGLARAGGWGAFLPLYALHPEGGRRPVVGDLAHVGRLLAPSGASVVATLPLLAAFTDVPFDPSPYAPVSRCFWNELYAASGGGPGTSGRQEDGLPPDAAPRRFDHRRQAAAARAALAAEAGPFVAAARRGAAGPDHEDFRRAVADPDLDLSAYARFRAAVAATGSGWPAWGRPPGELPDVALDPDEVDLHLYAQWVMRRQVADTAERLARQGQALYLDLPVGSHPDGFDTWRHGDLFARRASVGAPPDDFFTGGQDWGFPPVVPQASRRQAHRHLRACLRHHMEPAGALRLDHVMGLHRLFWVPRGAAATEGVYVRSPRDELFAVVALASHRWGCAVVGEDLGTVPDEIRRAMDRHGVLRMYVAEFQIPAEPAADPAAPAPGTVASIGTHDTPTFAGFVRDRPDRRRALAASLQRRGLVGPDVDDLGLCVALLRSLAASDADLVLVSLEDLWGEAGPQNVPGTGPDRPNWVQRFPDELSRLLAQPAAAAALAALGQARGPAPRP